MKRFNVSTMAAGLAVSMLCAPLAQAQPAPPHSAPGPQDMQHNEQHPAPVQPQHPGIPMQNSHPGPVAMQRAPEQHPPMQMSHNAPHPAPVPPRPPEQHFAQSGHHWHNGDRYNGDRHYVSNWSYYHLRQPPQGYEWVQDGSQFVLIAVATGVITDVILNALSH
jgi:Ni/Co efflux regulator RcnB